MDRIHPTTALALAAVALVIGLVAGAAGSSDDIPCQAGEVYVVDTERCVSGTDHEAHNGHDPDSAESRRDRAAAMAEAKSQLALDQAEAEREDLLTTAERTIEQYGMSCNASVAPTVDMSTLSRTCLMQLDIACNPDVFEGYVSLPGFPPIRCPWPPTDPDAESPANSIPPFPNHWYHGDH